MVRFDLAPPSLQGQMRIAKLKSAYNSLIIGPRGVCNVKLTYRKSWARNLMMVVRFDLGPLLQGQTRRDKFKSAYNWFIISPRGLHCETNV